MRACVCELTASTNPTTSPTVWAGIARFWAMSMPTVMPCFSAWFSTQTALPPRSYVPGLKRLMPRPERVSISRNIPACK